MKTIIAGSREGFTYDDVVDAISKCGWEITTVVSGGCRGVDSFGEHWAQENGVPVEVFPANWSLHGKSAGPIRNREMSQASEALIALHDGTSRGTKNMIEEATKKGLRVFVYRKEVDEKD